MEAKEWKKDDKVMLLHKRSSVQEMTSKEISGLIC